MQNFLMLLGWAPPDDREIMPFKELADLWRLEDVHSSPAYFDVKKLEAFNGEYIRAMSTEEFVERCAAVARGAARAVAPRAVRSRRVRGDGAARADAGHADDRGAGDGRFLVPRGTEARPRVVGQGNEGSRCRDGLRRRDRGLCRRAVGGRRAEGRARAHRRGRRAQARQGAGAGAGRRDRSHRRSSAVRVSRRARTRAHTGAARVLPAHTSEITAPTPVITDAAPRPRRRWARGIAIALVAIFGFLALYIGVTFVQVWMASRHDGATKSDAIVVLGAAQYDGRPSPVLTARLDHALELWQEGLAPLIVVTGGKQPGDRFTEATASANYLLERGVPDAQILREVQGTNVVGVARSGSSHPARARARRGDPRVRPVPRAAHRWHRRRARSHRARLADDAPARSRAPRRSVTWSRRPAPSRSADHRLPPPPPARGLTAVSAFSGDARRTGERYDARALRGWCNRQHSRFWPCRWGFESSPPSHSKDL